jgi:hypothetical protein
MGGIQQQPWTPTKRRGPIAAEYSSPGPACVTLPNLIGELFSGKGLTMCELNIFTRRFVDPVITEILLPCKNFDTMFEKECYV